jgi:HK97 family phage major capsid protein
MFKTLLKDKMAEQEAILNKAVLEKRAMNEEEQTKFEALDTEIKNIEKSIEAQNKIENREKENNTAVNDPFYTSTDNEAKKPFKNFAEQLGAVRNSSKIGATIDKRLLHINNAALGANEGNGADGGFLVQTDFAQGMMDSAVKTGEILSLVDSFEISSNSNSLKWNDIDETSVAATVYGGVMTYWVAEAGTATASKPKLIKKEIELEKLIGLAYATNEIEADSDFVSQLMTKSFTTAIQREMESAIISGSGAGKPIGFLKGGALVTIAKEGEQAASTIVYENIVKMYNRALNKQRAIWLMHPDVQEQLDFLEFPIGVGGVPVYLGASSIGSLSSLKGRPIIESDLCSALGSVGDINFVDLKEYMMIRKGGVVANSSIHVQFLTDENCYRFTFRANGMPKRNVALTLKNSTNTRSPFVTLAARG